MVTTETDLKKQAYDLAISLGCEIYTTPPEGGVGCTSWRCGMRSSADQYGRLFDGAEDAAVHFLTTREAQNAMKRREANDLTLIAQCHRLLVHF